MKILLLFFSATLLSFTAVAQQNSVAEKINDSIMVSIHLKHQQDKSLKEIQAILEKNKFWENFPPKSAKVISWYVMMGIGQVVTLKFPSQDLRKLNLSIENGAWGAFKTEFYPTYDFEPIWKEKMSIKN